jgi:asparagine synthase (glutamine-hydrolysing)
VLRNAMRGRLPDITVDRRDKQGYPTPGETWLRQYGTDYAGDILSSRRFRERGVFDAKATASAFQRWREGKAPLAALWTWLSTEEWFRRYFDNPLA